ncbi:MAG: zinc dependent phospholipase C family protein [Caldilineaceae bacterium]|nr:zinc dependent phospholipase C family protein [Caldilineaceae bacterium]HRJ44933.1 zinc dependent phospholipase C family protein [Caldilineaceae bacterium]
MPPTAEETRKAALLERMRRSRADNPLPAATRSLSSTRPTRRADQVAFLLRQLDELPRSRGVAPISPATQRAIEQAMLPQYNFPWYSNTHETMADCALAAMPEFVQNLVAMHKGFFVLGVVAPDKLYKDSVNHVYHVGAARTGQGFVGYGHSKVAQKLKLLQGMLAHSGQVRLDKQAARFLQGIAIRPCQLIAYEMGVLSHYICDLTQPFHTDQLERWEGRLFDETLCHKSFEADVREEGLERLAAGREVASLAAVAEPSDFAIALAQESSSHYLEIVRAYYAGPGKLLGKREDRLTGVWPIVQASFNRAVWATVSLWMAVGNYEKRLAASFNQDIALRKAGQLFSPEQLYRAEMLNDEIVLGRE